MGLRGEVVVATAVEMEALGRSLAAVLLPGDIIVLRGSLGVGKTLFISGIAQALGVEIQVTSPTFLLVRAYGGVLPLIHADVYRLSSTAEFTDLELIERAADGVLAIEWGDAVRDALPDDVLTVDIRADQAGVRTVGLLGEGEWQTRPLPEMA